MCGEAVGVRGVETRRGNCAVEPEIALVLLDAFDHFLEHGITGDVVSGLDNRVILGAVVLDDLLVVDDPIPLGSIWKRVHVGPVLVRVSTAVLAEQAVRLGRLQRFRVTLVLRELVVSGDIEHGRSVRFRHLRCHRGVVRAGCRGLNVHLHASLLGIAGCKRLQLVDDFRFVVHVAHMAFIGR